VKRPRYGQEPVRPSSSAVAMLPRKRLTLDHSGTRRFEVQIDVYAVYQDLAHSARVIAVPNVFLELPKLCF
jgi:hypothetical protein